MFSATCMSSQYLKSCKVKFRRYCFFQKVRVWLSSPIESSTGYTLSQRLHCHFSSENGNDMKLVHQVGKTLVKHYAKLQSSASNLERLMADDYSEKRRKMPQNSVFRTYHFSWSTFSNYQSGFPIYTPNLTYSPNFRSKYIDQPILYFFFPKRPYFLKTQNFFFVCFSFFAWQGPYVLGPTTSHRKFQPDRPINMQTIHTFSKTGVWALID